MRIGLDLDGVVYDFMKHFDLWMRIEKKKPLLRPECYDFEGRYDISDNKGMDFMREFGRLRPFIWVNYRKDAKKGIEKLARHGEVYVMTKRGWSQHAEKDTFDRILRDKLPIHTLLITKNKGFYSNHYGLDYVLEDSTKNAEDIINKSSAKVILFDHPYNQYLKHERVKRVNDWGDLIKDRNLFKNASSKTR